MGAAARVLAMASPHCGSAWGAPAATIRSSDSLASAGMQTSWQTRKPASAASRTVWPGLASAGAVTGTGSSTASS